MGKVVVTKRRPSSEPSPNWAPAFAGVVVVPRVKLLPSLEGRGWGWVGPFVDGVLSKRPTHPLPLPFREGRPLGVGLT
ncbi:hypothetical protein C8J42_101775 [Sphingomonas sp. PP-CE-1A-559]|nr:hypothetical protein C8J39_0454 [Sphingomonas sp. PP-CC-1A-547]TCM09806.1 hypothetical protein C8J41_101310 [Sphingomonas sp. PP-CC-3G-468]TCP94314.1 hypothetical protein C8J42_101775 [Sphingomonas sp. PP-CE-1A-559]